MKNTLFYMLSLCLSLVFLSGCKKESDSSSVIKTLHYVFKNGEIAECHYNGALVYSCAKNAYDSPTAIFDKDGIELAICDFAWGTSDSICFEIDSCVVVYRTHPNIWNKPEVNKYGL
jgi:hypothetical protein